MRRVRRALSAAASVAALLGAGASLLATPAYAETNCPNGAIRDAQGAFAKALPDCRAYELVSPGSNPLINSSGTPLSARASIAGNRFAYESAYPADNAQSNSFFYLATRGENGWSTRPAAPQDSPSASLRVACEQELNYTPDLSKSVLGDGLHNEPYCQSAEEELSPGAPIGYRNLFLREDATAGPYRLVNLTPQSAVPGNAVFVAGSADFSHIVFNDEAQLTPEAPAGASLYEWANGAVHLLTFLPSGESTQGQVVGSSSYLGSSARAQRAVSADGERVYFYSQGNLYARVNSAQPQSHIDGEGHCTEPERACTVQIDESQGTGSSGGGAFDEASADGYRAFFTDESRLTGDSHAEPGAPDLYEYDFDRAPGERLADLTVDASEPAHVTSFLGSSEDGSYVYFSATGVLATNKVENGNGEEEAQPGEPNLYLRRAGETTFVAGFANGGSFPYGGSEAQISPNGSFLVFASRDPLTGYDSTPANPSECEIPGSLGQTGPCNEIFRYDAGTGQLSCASCGPEGSLPTAGTFLARAQASGPESLSVVYEPRSVENGGRVFFDTTNALVPQDKNSARDVYEYENGQAHLISSGTSSSGSTFDDASASGNDVFLSTAQALLPSDTNNNDSVYDARVGGGFPEPPPAPECEGEACRVGGTVAPGSSSKATASFSGPGNPKVTHCKKGFVRKHGKCVRRKHHPKRHRSHKRAANANRRISR